MAQPSEDWEASPPSNQNSTAAWNDMSRRLCSVLMSEISFRTAQRCQKFDSGLESPYASVFSDSLKAMLVPEESASNKGDLYDGIDEENLERNEEDFSNEYAEQTKKSTAEIAVFTAEAARLLHHKLSDLDVKSDWHLSRKKTNSQQNETRGTVDLVFVTPCHGANSRDSFRDPVAIIQVGLCNSDVDSAKMVFKQKLHHAQAYLSTMADSTLVGTMGQSGKIGKLRMGGSVLLAVIIFDKKATTMRVGVFCCEKRGDEHFRMSLMYNMTAEKNLEIAFGTVIGLIIEFQKIRKSSHYEEWTYLGPNSVKVSVFGKEPQVYRAYDNRRRHTPRSPAVYKQLFKVVPILSIPYYRSARKLCMPFGTNRAFEETLHRGDTLFHDGEERGHLEVIGVPFYKGKHRPRSIKQLLCMNEKLKALHDKGIVHGDIRLFNIVFSEDDDNECHFIDFDLSGDEGTALYPSKYRSEVVDGRGRPKQAGYQPITMEDDRKALCMTFLFTTTLILKRGASITEWDAVAAVRALKKEKQKDKRVLDGYLNILESLVENKHVGFEVLAVPLFVDVHSKHGARAALQDGDTKSPLKGPK